MTNYLIIAALAASCAVVPAVTCANGQAVIIHRSDLDLRKTRDVAKLDRRIGRAAVKVCGPAASSDLAESNRRSKCIRETIAAALSQRNHAIAVAMSPPQGASH